MKRFFNSKPSRTSPHPRRVNGNITMPPNPKRKLNPYLLFLPLPFLFFYPFPNPAVHNLSTPSHPHPINPQPPLRPAAVDVQTPPKRTAIEPQRPPSEPPAKAQPPSRQAADDICLLIGTNPTTSDLWQFNSRALCLSHNICLSANKLSTTTNPQCKIVSHDYTPQSTTLPALIGHAQRNCSDFRRNFIHCAHGTGMNTDHAECPEISRNIDGNFSDKLTVVLPDYPYQMNIFHFQSTATDIFRTIHALPKLLSMWSESATKDVVLLFQGAELDWWFTWQHSLLKAIIDAFKMRDVNVEVQYMPNQTQPVCLRRAVVLGKKGNLNMWPYLNSTDIPMDGKSVPVDAVEFKRAVYSAFDVDFKLPTKEHPVGDAPPFVVGYAKRETKPWPEGHFGNGRSRRFSEEDEAWFEAMLKNETEAVGAELIDFCYPHGERVDEQVKTLAKVGFVVGIHGANLVNAMFMPPFGAFLELFPKHTTQAVSSCYLGGGNTGLKYMRFMAGREVGWKERGCREEDAYCREERQGMVDLGGLGEKEEVRRLVREGLDHLKKVRGEGEVRVRVNEETVYFDIDEGV